jgi:hypothetical protein
MSGLSEPRLRGVGLLGEPGGKLAQTLQQVLEPFGVGDQEDACDQQGYGNLGHGGRIALLIVTSAAATYDRWQ